ncbi:MAG TPA: tetratricopeptide repeat protein [Pyrinomonadaceae bacterium]|jgi:tetratricopeptide (TPR) repeat protein|nr:tetratricopeptide repeat protein [Pyrinomonadaceae bacterium]
MIHRKLISLVLLLACVPAVVLAQKISKEKIVFEGKKRTYYLYVPKTSPPGVAVPLVVLLHGSNHIGLSLAEKWDDLAEKEGVIIVAPDSIDSDHWAVPGDGPAFLHELVESLKSKYPIDAKRVYLFGHSGGAVFALLMSLYESEYFAATAIHAGALYAAHESFIDSAKRKIPIHIQVGTVDGFFPLATVRATRDRMNASGFSVQLVEIPGHDHWYYDLAPKINQTAWEFLKALQLPGEPRYEEYNFRAETRTSQEATDQYNLGVSRQTAGDLNGAITAYSRAIEVDRKYADAYNNRAVAYLTQKNYPAALADLTQSIELAPSAAAYNNRAGIYFSQNKIEEAIADFTAALKLKPSAEGYANRGVAYQQTNRDQPALADYEEAIKLNPSFGRAYVLRGLILLKRGEAETAQKDFERAFQLDSSLHAEFDPMIQQLRPKP